MTQPAPEKLSQAWVTFDRTGVLEEGATGLADRRTGRRLTTADPVRVASISKLVVALGVMRMVEAGQLDLDADVARRLGWSLRNPAYPNEPITLRMLLSHRSSLKDDADYVVPLGEQLETRLQDPRAYDREHRPGSFFRYTNLNFPLIASLMEKASGERFDRLIARLVLEPLNLDACYNWTMCSDVAVARAVVLYKGEEAVRDDLLGKRPECPVVRVEGGSCDLDRYELGSNGAIFSPQGGLRISMRDLAVIGRLLLARGKHDGKPFLSEASIAAITTPAWTFDGSNGETEGGFYCSYGLAVQLLPERAAGCHDDLFAGQAMLGHAGDAYGVRSGLWVDPASGRGIAFFGANNGEDPPRGARSAYRAVEEQLAERLKK